MAPYVGVNLYETVASQIKGAGAQFDDGRLEQFLAHIYSPTRLASMVLDRYPKTDVVDLYCETIAEAVAAHFSNLHHVAASGLMPVVEGIGRELYERRKLGAEKRVKEMFTELLTNAKRDAWDRRIGNTQEIDDMLCSKT